MDHAAVAAAGFWEAIKNNPSIVTLIFRFPRCMDAGMRDSIASLKELEALNFPDVVMHGLDEQRVSLATQVAQLTELSITVKGSLASELSCLVNLVYLKLQVYPDVDCSLDDMLTALVHLETLSVQREDGSRNICLGQLPESKKLGISTNALLELKELRSLSLDSVTVDEFFFQDLGLLTKLMKLELVHEKDEIDVQSVVSQIHMLEHLEELKLFQRDQGRMCSLL